jgi:uncharacterized membrane protein YhaH (DUF805 family)
VLRWLLWPGGRTGRIGYLIGMLLVFAAITGVYIAWTEGYWPKRLDRKWMPISFTVCLVVIYMIWTAVTVRRLHDVDRVGWWAILNFVAPFNVFLLVYLLLKSGTDGPNRFSLEGLGEPSSDIGNSNNEVRPSHPS